MEQYDEELHENTFFQTLQRSFPSILELVSESGWMVLVPCRDALERWNLCVDDIENHVVKAQEEEPTEFYTINKKELVIKSGVIVTGKGFNEIRQATILFEEMFYTEDNSSYRVLCISQPLEGGPVRSSEREKSPSLGENVKSKKPKIDISQLNLEDSCQYLWGYPKGSRIKLYITKTVDQLVKTFIGLRSPSLEDLIDKVKKTFEHLVRFLMKTPQFKRVNTHFSMYLALETYIMHKIYRQLMRFLGVHTKDRDYLLNKMTRNLSSRITLEHFGLKLQNSSSLDRSRIILNNFVRRVTPNSKIYQLRKVFYSLLYSIPGVNGNLSTMTSDDVIPLCAFLIIKSNTNNWWCHLLLMQHFSLSLAQFDQELQYFLSSMEASMVYLMSGKFDVLDVWSEAFDPPQLVHTALSNNNSLFMERLFQCITDKNLSGLEELKNELQNGANLNETKLCHPLCSCSACSGQSLVGVKVQSIAQALQVTNEAGFAAIHLACILGYHDVIDWMLNNGVDVNVKCLSGLSPLHLACARGFQVVVLLLLSHGANICATDDYGNNAIHIASLHGHFQCAKALVFVDQSLKKLDLNASNNQLDTAIHISTKWGFEDICNCLIENGASCLKRNKQHLLPSDLAPSYSLYQLVFNAATEENKLITLMAKRNKFLASERFDLPNKRGQNLTRSVNPLLEISALSLSQSLSSPTSSSFSSSSSSMRARVKHTDQLFGEGNDDTIFEEKTLQGDNFIKSENHRSGQNELTRSWSSPPSHHSTSNVDLSIASLAGQNKSSDDGKDEVDLNYKGAIEELLRYVRAGNVEMVKRSLNWSEYEQDHPGASSMDVTKVKLCHPLCQCEKCADAQWFLSSSTNRTEHSPGVSQPLNINSKSPDGHSPLHVSCKYGHVELTRLLLCRGALVNCGGEAQWGHYPIHLASRQPCFKIILLLLSYGADANSVDAGGNTPLHICSSLHFLNHALLLLLHAADANAVNRRDVTPLHNALRSSNFQIVSLLLIFGADLSDCKELCMKRMQTSSSLRQIIIESKLQCWKKVTSSSTGLLKSLLVGEFHDWYLAPSKEISICRRRRMSWSHSIVDDEPQNCLTNLQKDDSSVMYSMESKRWCKLFTC